MTSKENRCEKCPLKEKCKLANKIFFCEQCKDFEDCKIKDTCENGEYIECNNGFEPKD